MKEENLLNQLEEIKKKTGLPIKDIAKQAKISPRTIRRWRKGIHEPHPLHWEAFEKAIEQIRNFYRERGIKV